jgi:hypothetical protein
MAQPTSLRLSDVAAGQLRDLADRYGNQTTAVTVAIDRLWMHSHDRGRTQVEMLQDMGYEVATDSMGVEHSMAELVSEFNQMRPGSYWLSAADYGVRVLYEVMDGVPEFWLVQTLRQQALQREQQDRSRKASDQSVAFMDLLDVPE